MLGAEEVHERLVRVFDVGSFSISSWLMPVGVEFQFLFKLISDKLGYITETDTSSG